MCPFCCKDGQNSSCNAVYENSFIINTYDGEDGKSLKIYYLLFPEYPNFAALSIPEGKNG
jgi:hypothetical protein